MLAGSGKARHRVPGGQLRHHRGHSGTFELTGGGSGGTIASPGMVNAGSTNSHPGGNVSGVFAGSGTGTVDLSNFTVLRLPARRSTSRAAA